MSSSKIKNQWGRRWGPPIILNLRKFFTDCFQNLAQRFIGIQEYVNDTVLKKERSLGPLGVSIILSHQKFFRDYLQNLAQRFIGIQEYVNDIVLKKERSWGPLKF